MGRGIATHEYMPLPLGRLPRACACGAAGEEMYAGERELVKQERDVSGAHARSLSVRRVPGAGCRVPGA